MCSTNKCGYVPARCIWVPFLLIAQNNMLMLLLSLLSFVAVVVVVVEEHIDDLSVITVPFWVIMQ